MNKLTRNCLLAAALLATLPAFAADTAKDKPMSRTEIEHTTMSAEVVSVNLTNREVTLKGPGGDTVTFTASEAIKRLNEVKPGDIVRADSLVSVVAEIRKPTEEEAKHPLVILDAAGRSDKDMPPAAGTVKRYKVVTTIEVLDRRNNTVTVKGPLGRYLTARVSDPERLTKVRIGETVVIVYTEALVISLEKVEKKAGE